MKIRVKICCISSELEAREAIRAGADALGLVSHMPSGPGPIEDETIRRIASQVPPPVSRFLLTSETRAETIAAHVERCRVDTVQIVNHIDPAEYAALRARLPSTRLVQVIHVEGVDALDLIHHYAGLVDAFLLDSGRPSASIPELGGTGRVHDWSVSAEIVKRAQHPVFLAGGLNPDNVAEAIRTVRPYGLDICSGVRRDGRLDPALLARYMAAIRAAAADLPDPHAMV